MEGNADVDRIIQERFDRAMLQTVSPHTYKVTEGGAEIEKTCDGGVAIVPEIDLDSSQYSYGFPIANCGGCVGKVVYTNQGKWIPEQQFYRELDKIK